MQFADFVSSGFTAVVNLIAKSNYRWAQNSDIVVRMPCGGGVGAGPFHSQTNEVWFTKVPGLKVVYPSHPYEAKGLLNASIDDPNPVMYFEHKFLYRTVSEEIPSSRYTLELGKGKIRNIGSKDGEILKKKFLEKGLLLRPSEVKKFLDDFVIGQNKAKKNLSVESYRLYFPSGVEGI